MDSMLAHALQVQKKRKLRNTGVLNVRQELSRLEESIEVLRLEYEKFFTGLVPFAPEKLHGETKRLIRRLWKAPFKKSETRFKLKTLEGKYNTLNTYWQRVLKAKEEGTYFKDVFKADMREKIAAEEAYLATAKGAAETGMRNLFNAYKDAIEKTTGAKQGLDFEKFKTSLVSRAKEFKAKNEGKKISFKIVVSNGKVTIKAKAK